MKSKKLIVISVILFLVLTLIIAYYSGIFKSSTKNSYIQLKFYDINGKEVNPNKNIQSIVNLGGQGPIPGIFYMKFEVWAGNEGTVRVDDLSYRDIEPIEFNQALQNSALETPFLQPGQAPALLWRTINQNGQFFCSNNQDCGASEICIINECRMPVNSFNGSTDFNLNVSGEYTDAYGIRQTTADIPFLNIEFTPERTILRTNANTATCQGYGVDGTWIAYDKDNDQNLYGFGATTQLCTNFQCANPSRNPQNIDAVLKGQASGCHLYTYDINEICVCTGGTNPIKYRMSDPDALLADTDLNPHEGYISLNCNGEMPCQEVYVSSLLIQSCSDGTQNQDETDIDCGGSVCPRCAGGQMCVISRDCASNNCLPSGVCSEPTGGGSPIFLKAEVQVIG